MGVLYLYEHIVADLNPKETMMHFVHLKDLHNKANNPFQFLSIPSSEYSRYEQISRGNRIRKSRWKSYFDEVEGTNNKFIYEHVRYDRSLPLQIDSTIQYKDENDLKISHIGIYTKKENLRIPR